MAVQVSYCYNIVRTDSRDGGRPVTWHLEPRTFAGTADQFAKATLDDVMSRNPQLAGEFVFVNVWASDDAGVFVPAHIIGRASHDPKASIRRSAPVAGGTLPATPASLVRRTDFSDDRVWDTVCAASAAESLEGFAANLSFVRYASASSRPGRTPAQRPHDSGVIDTGRILRSRPAVGKPPTRCAATGPWR